MGHLQQQREGQSNGSQYPLGSYYLQNNLGDGVDGEEG